MPGTTAERDEPISVSGPSAPLVAGIAIWAAAMVGLPAPLAARILLLAPLVIVPRLISLLPPRRWIAALDGWPLLLAALPLLVAFSLPTGPVAASFGVPWLAVALVGTLAAIKHRLSQIGTILQPDHLPALGIDVALGFWGVAATSSIIERLGIDTGFSPVIVLLTATHFHFAGVGLLGLASLHAVSRPWLRVSVLGLIIGIPITALGFVLARDPINAFGALVVGSSGVGVAFALLRPRALGRAVWPSKASGVALLIGMPMGIAWSFAILTGQSFLDLDTMIRTHGVLNALAVLIGVTAYRTSNA
jgi:YndJ-like protein